MGSLGGPVDPGDQGDPGGPGGLGGPGIRVARTTSLGDMHSENIWFSWYKPSKYSEKLICHACDGRRTDERTESGK